MKFYYLIEQVIGHTPRILYSVKDKTDVMTMLLQYVKDFEIKQICQNAVDLYYMGSGSYLEKINDNHYELVKVENTGYIRNYYEVEKISDLYIQEFETTKKISDTPPNEVVISELTATMVKVD